MANSRGSLPVTSGWCSHQKAAPPDAIKTNAIKASKRRTTLPSVCMKQGIIIQR
jgi:hypothetical protein